MMTPAHLLRTLAAGTAAVLCLACKPKVPEHGVLVPNRQAPPPLHLADAQGRVFDLAAQRGRPTFIFFGYTHCPDACPTTLSDWARARALLGSKGSNVHFVFVSVDPARDTPDVAQRYARQFDSTFTGLVASPVQLDSIKTAWGFMVERDEMPGMKAGEYGVTHPAGVYFIDGDGIMKFVFAPGSKPAEIASDIGRLM